MLFPYTYVPHQMDKMQEFVDYIFFDVWCNAPSNNNFCLELFDANSELREVMEIFYYSDKKNADFFIVASSVSLDTSVVSIVNKFDG